LSSGQRDHAAGNEAWSGRSLQSNRSDQPDRSLSAGLSSRARWPCWSLWSNWSLRSSRSGSRRGTRDASPACKDGVNEGQARLEAAWMDRYIGIIVFQAQMIVLTVLLGQGTVLCGLARTKTSLLLQNCLALQ
jgi:hypothetical protein